MLDGMTASDAAPASPHLYSFGNCLVNRRLAFRPGREEGSDKNPKDYTAHKSAPPRYPNVYP